VGAGAVEIVTCTMLFLSEKVTSLPDPFRVQPSG
jgi:hypothetical protein